MPLKKYNFSLGYNVGSAFSKKQAKAKSPALVLKPKAPPIKTKPRTYGAKAKFRVVELGHGNTPYGLVQKAAKKRGTKTEFIGVETKKVNLAKTLKLANARKLPPNLRFERTCALKALKKMPSESTHLVFASYLLNNISYNRVKSGKEWVSMDIAVVNEAKRILVPGGRFVAIGDKGSVDKYEMLASASGLKFHAVEIPDAVASKSCAQYIRERGTPKGRMDYFTKYLRGSPMVLIEYEMLAQRGIVQELGDMAKPVIYLLRKPRTDEQRVKPVGMFHTIEGTTALNEREKEIVREILTKGEVD